MVIADIVWLCLILLLVAWIVSNIARYVGRKTGGTGGWFALSDAWIKADEKKVEPPKTETPKVETKGKEKK